MSSVPHRLAQIITTRTFCLDDSGWQGPTGVRELSTYDAQAAIYNACQSWFRIRGQEGEGRQGQLVDVFVTEVRRSQRFRKGKA